MTTCEGPCGWGICPNSMLGKDESPTKANCIALEILRTADRLEADFVARNARTCGILRVQEKYPEELPPAS